MSTRRSTGSTRGPDSPSAKKAPAKRARAKQDPKQEARPDVKQDVAQEASLAPAVMAREPSPPPVVARPQVAPPSRIEISADARRAMVAEAAYLRAERRGFSHGGEVEDWLAAEAEVDKLLTGGHGTWRQ